MSKPMQRYDFFLTCAIVADILPTRLYNHAYLCQSLLELACAIECEKRHTSAKGSENQRGHY